VFDVYLPESKKAMAKGQPGQTTAGPAHYDHLQVVIPRN
jgi:hypothetical protein